MNIRDIILPREKTKNLRWFDVIIITLILFGKFIVISTQMYLATLKPAVEAAATAVTEAATEVAETTTDVATEGAAYSSNLRYQATMLAIVFIYLFIRNFVIIKDGKVVDRVIGAVPQQALEEKLDAQL